MVKPSFTYSIGTWAIITQSKNNKLEAFHRKQLRTVLGIINDLYQRTKSEPRNVSCEIDNARHTLRMGNKVPAKKAMIAYFYYHVENNEGFVGRPKTTLPTKSAKTWNG